MTERELSALPFLNQEIEQLQARLQDPNNDPATCRQSVRDIVAEYCAWTKTVLERRIAERDKLEDGIAAINDDFTRQVMAFHYAAGMPWKTVAERIGHGCTEADCQKAVTVYFRLMAC